MRDDRSGIGTGILLITVGLLFLGDRQGLLQFERLWPLILIVLGISKLAFPRDAEYAPTTDVGRRRDRMARRSRASGGLWLILVGAVLLANVNHWMAFRDSWPLFIVAGGLSIIIGSVSRRSDPSAGPSSGADPVDQNSNTPGGGSWR